MKFWCFHQCMTLHNKRSLLVPSSSFCLCCLHFLFLFEALLLLLYVWRFFFLCILCFHIDGYGRQFYNWHTIFCFAHIVAVNNVFSNTFICLHHHMVHSNLGVLSNSLVIWWSKDQQLGFPVFYFVKYDDMQWLQNFWMKNQTLFTIANCLKLLICR